MGRRTGFEPATSRFADDVTAIFTTDRAEDWRGTGDAVAALAGEPPFGVRGSNPLGAVAPLPRSNRHLHHRLADACASTIEWARWGTGDIGVSDVNAGSCLAEEPEPATQQPCKAASTVRDSKGGIRTRSFPGAKYPKSSPPALVEPQDAANQITKKMIAAL
jgi:hypothetical protein